MTDYYAALGVSKNATTDELARAYRQQAQRCHPDHGGSHEAMVRLNEAWEILRDPAARRDYDKTFSEHQPQSTTLSTAVSRAKAQASNYPSRWADFEPWMNSFLDDFTKAEYGWGGGGMYQFPTAPNSISGKVFIGIGIVAGLLVGIMLWQATGKSDVFRFLVLLGIALGGSAGMLTHKLFASGVRTFQSSTTSPRASRTTVPQTPNPHPPTGGMRQTSPPPIPQTVAPPETSRRIKITCPHCAQHIEAPAEVIDTVISCPTCSKEFHVGKRSTQPPPIPTRKQPPPIP